LTAPSQKAERPSQQGKLRIGNDWNAITIIALSQSNPLKAIAELVENSIDARATSVTIIRGKREGSHYLEVRDNGQGIPRDEAGRPDFRYVATHICDSLKRRLKVEGAVGLQGNSASDCFRFGFLVRNWLSRQQRLTAERGRW
jgi:DNA gyrase/topoisomerase IV subunit B